MATSIKSNQIYNSPFQHFLNAQDRSEPVPDTHIEILLDQFHIERLDDTPLSTLREEWNKVSNLERISWVEDQQWEYEIFLQNQYNNERERFDIRMMLLLTKEAAVAYLLRWS